MRNAHPIRRRSRPARGFSLFELIVVMLIIGTLSAIAVPRYSRSLARYRADSTARRIVADLDYARTLARTTNTRIKVKFDTAESKPLYRLEGVADPDHPGSDYEVRIKDAPYEARFTEVTFVQKIVAFSPYGEAVKHDGKSLIGTERIVIEAGGETRTITLDGPSGAASFQ